jgi:hypothetical protein
VASPTALDGPELPIPIFNKGRRNPTPRRPFFVGATDARERRAVDGSDADSIGPLVEVFRQN